jgi:hypothetical protein
MTHNSDAEILHIYERWHATVVGGDLDGLMALYADERELLAPVYEWFTEGFDTLDLKEAKALLDALTRDPRNAVDPRDFGGQDRGNLEGEIRDPAQPSASILRMSRGGCLPILASAPSSVTTGTHFESIRAAGASPMPRTL